MHKQLLRHKREESAYLRGGLHGGARGLLLPISGCGRTRCGVEVHLEVGVDTHICPSVKIEKIGQISVNENSVFQISRKF